MMGLFHYWINIKLYHWTTTNYARHIATDQLLTALLPLIDRLAEIHISAAGRQHFQHETAAPIVPVAMTDAQADQCLDDFFKYIQLDVVPRIDSNPEMRTITDDILNEINQCKYKFSFS